MNRRHVYKQMLSIQSSRLDEVLMDDTKALKVKSCAPMPFRMAYLAR